MLEIDNLIRVAELIALAADTAEEFRVLTDGDQARRIADAADQLKAAAHDIIRAVRGAEGHGGCDFQ